MGWGEENGEILPECNTNHPDGEHHLLSGLVHLSLQSPFTPLSHLVPTQLWDGDGGEGPTVEASESLMCKQAQRCEES